MNAEDWKSLFREIGLSGSEMDTWHSLFEQKFPEDHQSFLEWLGMDADRIRDIRTKGQNS